jgi:hypothetical protein
MMKDGLTGHIPEATPRAADEVDRESFIDPETGRLDREEYVKARLGVEHYNDHNEDIDG